MTALTDKLAKLQDQTDLARLVIAGKANEPVVELLPQLQATLDQARAATKSEFAASGGAAKVGFIQSGTGAVARTVQDKAREVVSVKDFGAKGDGVTDDTAAFQTALNAISLTGGDLYVPNGTWKITDSLTITGSNVRLLLDHNAAIMHSTPSGMVLDFQGSNCSIDGGLGAGFIGPAEWDGANVAPTYAVIRFSGNNCRARTRLFNFKKVGIWFKDCNDGVVDGCHIEGNYPSSLWTGVETVHFGILFDPSSTTTAGNFRAINTTIKSCVQGIMAANYGSGPLMMLGLVLSGCNIEGCWNHGLYSNFTAGAVVVGTNFNRCQISAVVSGDNNVFSGCGVYTAANAAGDERDVVGISVRDGRSVSITGSTFRGVLTTASSVCISVQDVNGMFALDDIVIASNTIDISDGAGVAIRILGSAKPVNRFVIGGNTIRCPGKASEGAIAVYGQSDVVNAGGKIHDNIVTLTAPNGWGISYTNMTAIDVHHNTVEYAFNGASASTSVTVAAINATNCTASENTSLVRSTFGQNLFVYGYREFTSASGNTARNSINAVNTTMGAGYEPILPIAGSNLLIDHSGPGAPSYNCRIGSRWYRTDGGASTTFYLRESATPTVWRAV